MFTILKAKKHHHNTHYDVALTHQNLPFHKSKSGSSEKERERERKIIINNRLKCRAQNHNPYITMD